MSNLANNWEQVGGAIQSLDAPISDYLMPIQTPLNRYISDTGFSEVGLRTSLRSLLRLVLRLVPRLILRLILRLVPRLTPY